MRPRGFREPATRDRRARGDIADSYFDAEINKHNLAASSAVFHRYVKLRIRNIFASSPVSCFSAHFSQKSCGESRRLADTAISIVHGRMTNTYCGDLLRRRIHAKFARRNA